MPLIIAAILYGGTFFGYTGFDTAHTEILQANQVQQHWLELKRAAIDKVANETLKEVR
jgi:hypothetical protein